MADDVMQLKADLDLDITKFKSKLEGTKGIASSFGSHVGGVFADVGKAAVAMSAVATGAFVGFAAISVKAANESDEVLAQLGAVLKSTGGAAKVTSQAAIDLSKALQRTTTYSDEQVLSAENLLLTFTNIGKKVFPQATSTVLDMATALGEDTKDASIQLGKALQDPILGITALRRVGVNFTDKQKEVIKNLVETGHSLEAQKLILKELNTEFGGSAAAATKTFGGALKQLNNSVNDLEEQFGKAIINAITPFVKSLADWSTSKAGQDAINALINGFQVFSRIVGNLVTLTWPYFMQGLRLAFNAVQFLITPLRLIYDTISGGDPTLYASEMQWRNFAKFLMDFRDVVIGLVTGALSSLKQAWDFLKPSLEVLWTTLSTNLIPNIIKFTNEVIIPLVKVLGPIVGVGLLWALQAIIDIADQVAHAIGTALGWLADNKDVLVIAAGAIVLLAGKAGLAALPGLVSGLDAFAAASLAATAPWIALALQVGAITAVFAAIYKFGDWLSKKSTGNSLNDQFMKGIFSSDNSTWKAITGLIPHFAQGGIVPGSIGQPQLAVVHGGEQVIPTSRAGSGGDSITINLTGVMASSKADLRQVGEQIIGAIDEARRAKGKATILG